MASKIEEQFVSDNLKLGSILEFGAGDCAFISSLGRDVIAVDLYKPERELPSNIEFIHSDVLGIFGREFDNIIALSSFEHVGIETYHFKNDCVETRDLLQATADHLVSLLAPGGSLIITVPFGTSNMYGVDANGNNDFLDLVNDPHWGFRTMQLSELEKIFSSLKVSTAVAFKIINKDDYFNPKSWEEISPQEHELCDNKNRGLLCVVFKKEIDLNDYILSDDSK